MATRIAITGTLGAGKGEIVNYLQSKGFEHFSFSDYFKMELQMRGREINRDEMVKIANELRAELGEHYMQELLADVYSINRDYVIESIRTRAGADWLLKQENTFLFSIDAPIDLRYERISKRKSEKDLVSFEKFCEQEKLEMENEDSSKQNIAYCMELVPIWFQFINDSDVHSLHTQIDLAMNIVNQRTHVNSQ